MRMRRCVRIFASLCLLVIPENRVDNIIGREGDTNTQTHCHEQHHKKCTSPSVSEEFIMYQLHKLQLQTNIIFSHERDSKRDKTRLVI